MTSILIGLIGINLCLIQTIAFSQNPPRPKAPDEIPIDNHLNHTPTGVIFPAEIEGLQAPSYSKFHQAGTGIGIRYQGEAGTRADVYIADRGLKKIEDDPTHKHIVKEISDTVAAVKQIEKMGSYSNVIIPDSANIATSSDLTLISLPFTYEAAPTAPGAKSDQWQSLVAVTIYRDHFFKIRYSFNGEANQQQIDQRTAFVDYVLSLIIEARLFPQIDEWLDSYFEMGPLSKEGKDLAGGLVGFVENSKLVSMKIDMKLMPFLETDDYPETSTLLAGYIIGNLRSQWHDKKLQDDPLAGVTQSLRVYEQLIGKSPKQAKHPGMENFLKLEKEGKLDAEIKKLTKSDKSG